MNRTTGLSTDEVAAKCREEYSHRAVKLANAFSACWELFRRAFTEEDQQAWQALFIQYRLLVKSWAPELDLAPDDLMADVLGRFWIAVHNRDFAAHFPTIQQVMSYLKRCTLAYVIDIRRDTQRQKTRAAAILTQGDRDPPIYQDAGLQGPFLEKLKALLHGRLQGENEWIVFRETYENDLAPREIATKFPDHFEDAREVSRIKARILNRLLSDPEVQRWQTSSQLG